MKKIKKTPKSRKDANLSASSNVKKGEMTSDGISATLTGIASGTDSLDVARAREKALEDIYKDHVPMVYNLVLQDAR